MGSRLYSLHGSVPLLLLAGPTLNPNPLVPTPRLLDGTHRKMRAFKVCNRVVPIDAQLCHPGCVLGFIRFRV